MKKNYTLTKFLIVFACVSTFIHADDFGYIRKSISGPKEIWISAKNEEILQANNKEFLNTQIKRNIEIKRFDYNKLPDYVFQSIFDTLSTNDSIDETEIAKLVDTYAAPEIESILNNPAIQQQRIEAQKNNQKKFTFADTKGKSQDVLSEDLNTFFNSSFIYFPYIKEVKANIHEKSKTVHTKITGGIVWYQIRDDGNGHKKVVRIKTIEASGNDESKIQQYDKPEVKLDQSLRYSILKWCNELAVATKGLEEFQLSGQITEARSWKYNINLGDSQGVDLDDAYQILDYQEVDGKEVLVPVGFGIVSKVKNNDSTLSQQLGKNQTIGSYIKEYPRLSSHIQFSLGTRTGLDIRASEIEELKSDIKEGIMASLRLSQNLASFTHIPQFFIGTQLEFTPLVASLDDEHTGLPFLFSYSVFLEKKFWYRSSALFFNTSLGNERFYLKGSAPGKSYDIMLESAHADIGIGYEKLINPNLSFVCSVEKRFSTGINSGTIKYNDQNKDDVSFSTDFDKTRFGGTLIRFGLNYIIPATFKVR